VYLLMIATLAPGGRVSLWAKVAVMLGLYLLGANAAFVFAWLFKRTLLKGAPPVMIMELPPYRLPRLRDVAMHMAGRAWMFLKNAGTVILVISIVLWFLSTHPKTGGNGGSQESGAGSREVAGTVETAGAAGVMETAGAAKSSGQSARAAQTTQSAQSSQLENSYAGMVGRAIEPVIKPLGFDWRIGIGLVGSLMAREVFVSTMSVVLNIDQNNRGVSDSGNSAGTAAAHGAGAPGMSDRDEGDTTTLRAAFAKAAWPDGRLLFTPLVCVTLMVFYVFAMQCMSTLAVVRRETNSWRWPLFQLAYMTGAAWVVCFLIYQGGRALGF
jgi:ferrous iron transport protein B